MKRLLLSTLLAGVAALGLASSTQAQTKIGIINLQKVFDGYWKTRQSDTLLNEQFTEYKKTDKEFTDTYQKANEEYRKQLDSASDQAVATEERDKRKKLAEDKYREMQKIEDQIRTFRQTYQNTMTERYTRMRERVLQEIMEVITTKSKEAGYALVFDTASQSRNQTLVVLYSNGDNDLTQVVLRKLNEGAPPEFLKPRDEKTNAVPDFKGLPLDTKPEKKGTKK